MDIQTLPKEIIFKILSYLSIRDLARTKHICCLRDGSNYLLPKLAARVVQKYLKLLRPFHNCIIIPLFYMFLYDRICYTILRGKNITKTWLQVNGVELRGTRCYYKEKKDEYCYCLIKYPFISGRWGLPKLPEYSYLIRANPEATFKIHMHIYTEYRCYERFHTNQIEIDRAYFNIADNYVL